MLGALAHAAAPHHAQPSADESAVAARVWCPLVLAVKEELAVRPPEPLLEHLQCISALQELEQMWPLVRGGDEKSHTSHM
jgi:hypothetical protein